MKKARKLLKHENIDGFKDSELDINLFGNLDIVHMVFEDNLISKLKGTFAIMQGEILNKSHDKVLEM